VLPFHRLSGVDGVVDTEERLGTHRALFGLCCHLSGQWEYPGDPESVATTHWSWRRAAALWIPSWSLATPGRSQIPLSSLRGPRPPQLLRGDVVAGELVAKLTEMVVEVVPGLRLHRGDGYHGVRRGGPELPFAEGEQLCCEDYCVHAGPLVLSVQTQQDLADLIVEILVTIGVS